MDRQHSMSTICFTCLSKENTLNPMKNVYWEILKALLAPDIGINNLRFDNTELRLCEKCSWLLQGFIVFRDEAVNSVRRQLKHLNQNNETVEEEEVRTKIEILDDIQEDMVEDPLVVGSPLDDLKTDIKEEIVEEFDDGEELCQPIAENNDGDRLQEAGNLETVLSLTDSVKLRSRKKKQLKSDECPKQRKRKKTERFAKGTHRPRPLTQAERQKMYRERLKHRDPEKYLSLLKRNADRSRLTRKRISEYTLSEQDSIRKEWRDRKKKKTEKQSCTEAVWEPEVILSDEHDQGSNL